MAIVYQNDVAGKICANSECGWKPLGEFAPARLLGMPIGDGYKSRCRDCFNAQNVTNERQNQINIKKPHASMLKQIKNIFKTSNVLIKRQILAVECSQGEDVREFVYFCLHLRDIGIAPKAG